jgi:hypothetical protein
MLGIASGVKYSCWHFELTQAAVSKKGGQGSVLGSQDLIRDEGGFATMHEGEGFREEGIRGLEYAKGIGGECELK